ncbi:MAG TPA: ion channel [Rhizomicrobium sp.]|nr:ion channel [Rhizomicrobium sp.]
MFANLTAGSLFVAATVLIHTGGLVALARLTPRMARTLGLHSHDTGRALVMMMSVLGIFALHTLEVWLWASGYAFLGTTESFSDALDLSTAMFSTVGYGQIVIAPIWRLLTALEGIDGFILIGWSTAYLVGVSTRHGPFRKAEHF